jgi:nucleoside-diphosphate-sugar epimerase
MMILVTGAAGLIGSHLVDDLLKQGHKVVGLDNLSFGNMKNLENALSYNKFSFIEEDVTNLHQISVKFDVIYHMASLKKVWDGSVKSSEVMDVNYTMTKNVVDKSLAEKSKLIFASTSDIYGNSQTFSEESDITMGPPTNIRYSYALSKWHSEQYILNCVKESNLDASIVRVFGCASHRSNKYWSGGHIPLFIRLALDNKDIHIHGDGSQTRSISHASDISMGFCSLLENFNKVNGQIINMGTDQQTSVRYVAEYIIKATGSRSKTVYEHNFFKDYNEIMKRYANTQKAKNLLGYRTRHTTEEVIDGVIQENEE